MPARGIKIGREGKKHGKQHTNGNEHMDPDLPVLHGVEDILPRKLVCEAAPVLLETFLDLGLFFRGQETRSLKVDRMSY